MSQASAASPSDIWQGDVSLIRKAVAERRAFGDSLADVLESLRGGPTIAGVHVTAETAMRQSAVWACVNLIADIAATLPIDAYEKRGTLPEPVSPTPSLLVAPSQSVDAISWRRQVFVSWLMRGNVYGIVQRLTNGWPAQIEILHPDQVTVTRVGKQGPPTFRVDGKPIDKFPAGNLWHVPGLTMPGAPVGVSVLEYARLSIGLGIAAQSFGAQWFDEGAHPSAILKTAQKVDETQAKVIKDRFLNAVRGKREPAVLGLGMDYQPIQVSANESQFLETIKANAEDIARFFFPSFILTLGQGSITYQNVEQRSLNLLTYDLDPWLVRFERAMTALLPGGPSDRYVKLNRDALLRTDTLTRYRLHDIAIRGGWKSRDEVREKEELAPIPDGTGGEFLWPPYRAFPIESDQEQ